MKAILRKIPYFTKIELMFDYAIVSLIATIIDVAILYSLTDFLRINYLVSATIGYCCGLIIAFYLQKRYTFKKVNTKIRFQFAKFATISLIGLLINLIILKIFVTLGVWYIFAKVISIIIVFFWNFLVNKKVTFGK